MVSRRKEVELLQVWQAADASDESGVWKVY